MHCWNVIGCAYGDKDPVSCRSRLIRSNCYEASFADTCCDSCNRMKSSKVGCEYGDTADWCPTQSSYTCYESGSTCCETCQKFYDSRNPGRAFNLLYTPKDFHNLFVLNKPSMSIALD